MSLKLVPFESLGAVSYSPSIVTVAVSVAVCEIFAYVFLFTFHRNYGDILHRLRVIATYW